MALVAHIVAMSDHGLIGIDGGLPWKHNSVDMAFFKQHTSGHLVAMGYKTVMSIPKKLPNRTIVGMRSTRENMNYDDYHSRIDHSIPMTNVVEELKRLHLQLTPTKNINKDIIFIAGGGKVYEDTIGEVDLVYQNIINGTIWHEPTVERVYYPVKELREQFTCIHEQVLGYGGDTVISRLWMRNKE